MKAIAATSLWIDHLKKPISHLQRKLEDLEIFTHSSVILELTLGSIKNRKEFLSNLKLLPAAIEASPEEVVEMIEKNRLFGMGLSAIDAKILSSALLSQAGILTRDKAMLKAMKILKINSF